jgi:hypothetical protein
VPVLLLFVFIPAPSVLGVPSVVFPLVGGAFGSQSTSFIPDESLFCPLILENLSYPQVEDKSLVSPLGPLLPIEIDLLNLLPSPPPHQTTSIVDQVLGFDSDNDAPLF